MSEIQIHRIFINASPDKVWAAITTPEFSRLYGYTGDVSYDLRPGGAYHHAASEEMKSMGMTRPRAPSPGTSSPRPTGPPGSP